MTPKEKSLLSAILEILNDYEADIDCGQTRIHLDSYSRYIDLPDLDTETLQAMIG